MYLYNTVLPTKHKKASKPPPETCMHFPFPQVVSTALQVPWKTPHSKVSEPELVRMLFSIMLHMRKQLLTQHTYHSQRLYLPHPLIHNSYNHGHMNAQMYTQLCTGTHGQSHMNIWLRHSQAEILICVLYACAWSVMSFERGRNKVGKKRKRGGGETPGSRCWERITAGYCIVVFGKHRMGVVIVCLCVCECSL